MLPRLAFPLHFWGLLMIDKAAVPLGRGLGCQVQGAAGLRSGSADCVRKLVGNL